MNGQQEKYVLIACISSVVVLASIYFLFRKRKNSQRYYKDENDELVEYADLNAQDCVASAVQSRVEIQVPSFIVGSIIGKNGTNIRQLKSQFGVRFDFISTEANDLNNSVETDLKKPSERTLVITGNRDQVHSAEQYVKKYIKETPPFIVTEVLVPQSTCGRIIGKGGQNIREMCNSSGAKIVVDRNKDYSIGNQCRVHISGTKIQVDYAKLLVEEKVQQEIEFNKKIRMKENFLKQDDSNLIETIQSDVVQLPTNDYFKVFVSAIDTPEHIWVQYLHSKSTSLDALIKEMTQVYGGKQSLVPRIEKGARGDICAAPYDHDEEIFRACIKSVNLDSRTVELYYIDFGDTGYQPIDQLKQIRPEHLLLPAQAIECFLPITSNGEDWSEEALDYFNNIAHCAEWIPLIAKVIGYKDTSAGKYPMLQLVDNTEEKEVNIIEEMIQKGYAIESSEPLLKHKDMIVIEAHPNNNEYSGFQFKRNKSKPSDECFENVIQEDIFTELANGDVFNEAQRFYDISNNASPQQLYDGEEQPNDQCLRNQFLNENEVVIETSNKLPEYMSNFDNAISLTSGGLIQNKTSSESSTESLCDIPTPDSTLSRLSSDDFVDIDDNTVSGAILAVVNEHFSDNLKGDEEFKELNGDIDMSSEETVVNDNEFSELQKSLEETSRKNVKSMEFTSDDDDDTGSFFSARSEVTITDVDDTNAEDRLTPESDISVNIPNFSSVELLDSKSISDLYDSIQDLTPKGPNSNQKNELQYKIQIIDEKTMKVLSSESLKASNKDSKEDIRKGFGH